jgi:hypothetical protein
MKKHVEEKIVQMKEISRFTLDTKDRWVRAYYNNSAYRQDFIDCKRIAEVLLEKMTTNEESLKDEAYNDIQVIVNALWNSFIVTYMKCFTNSDYRGHIDYSKVQKILKSEDFLKVHEHITELRHDHVAHSLDSKHSTLEVYGAVFVDTFDNRNVEYRITSDGIRTHLPSRNIVMEYIKMSQLFIDYFTKTTEKVARKLHEQMEPIHLKLLFPDRTFNKDAVPRKPLTDEDLKDIFFE